MERTVMSFTTQQRRAFFWALGIAAVATLTSLAWHQIMVDLTRFWIL